MGVFDIGRLWIDNLTDNPFRNQEVLTKRESKMTSDERVAADIKAGTQEWSKEYDHHINNPPEAGDILEALGSDAKVQLIVELAEDTAPFIYGRAYVPEIVGTQLGWFLQDSSGQNFHGWKCILMPRARTELIRKFGLQSETMEVTSLKVVRLSKSGKSLLCEVHDYGIEEPVQDTEPVQAAQPVQDTDTEDERHTVSQETLNNVQKVANNEVEEPVQKPELTI